MRKCTFLVGVPAAGKSTYLLSDRISPRDYMDAEVLSTDYIIEELAYNANFTYDEAFPLLIKFAEKCFWNELEDLAEAGRELIIDRTNMSVKSRKRIFDVVTKYDYECHAIVFPAPEPTEWNRRLNSRPGKTIPLHIIDSMVNSFEMPTCEEGFTTVVINSEGFVRGTISGSA